MIGEPCDTCNGTGLQPENEQGGQAFCTDCEIGLKKIEDDNLYYFGTKWYPFFTKEKFDKSYGRG